MNTVRFDSPGQPQTAQNMPTQTVAAQQLKNSVAPQSTDIRPPEAVEKLAKTTGETKHAELAADALDENGERRPPPPLKEYARIPTRMTAEILRLQEEALEKSNAADKAEAEADAARMAANYAEAAEETARASQEKAVQSTDAPEIAPQPAAPTAAPHKSAASTTPSFALNLSAVSSAPAETQRTLDYQA